jgi:hypothetical protein
LRHCASPFDTRVAARARIIVMRTCRLPRRAHLHDWIARIRYAQKTHG